MPEKFYVQNQIELKWYERWKDGRVDPMCSNLNWRIGGKCK
jgi:hypothetical protein